MVVIWSDVCERVNEQEVLYIGTEDARAVWYISQLVGMEHVR